MRNPYVSASINTQYTPHRLSNTNCKNLPLHSQRLGHVEEPGSNSWRWPFRTRGIPTDGVSDEDFVYFLIVCFYVAGSDVFNMLQGMLQWCCDLVCRSRFLHIFVYFLWSRKETHRKTCSSIIIINLQSEKESLNHAVFAVPQLLRSEVIAFSRFVLYIDLNRSGKSSYQSICVLLYFSHALLCNN